VYRTIREEPIVTLTLQRAAVIYPRAWDAYEALCWVLVRRQPAGASFQGTTNLYHLHKQAPGPLGVPEITVLYTVSNQFITLHAMKVG
jgi:hypothetical protein